MKDVRLSKLKYGTKTNLRNNSTGTEMATIFNMSPRGNNFINLIPKTSLTSNNIAKTKPLRHTVEITKIAIGDLIK